MLKKIIYSCSVLTLTYNVVYAANGTPYVGGSLGITNLGQYGNQFKVGGIGKLYTGYGKKFGIDEKVYLGGELNLDLANYPNLYDNGTVSLGLGASLIGGYYVTKQTMIYGRLGEEVVGLNKSYVGFGTQYGLGVQTALTEKLDLRTEYTRLTGWGSQLNLGLTYKF